MPRSISYREAINLLFLLGERLRDAKWRRCAIGRSLFLLLLVFVVSFAALARRLKIPYPIVLVIAGLLLEFLPGMARISLDPDIVFLVFLPRDFMPRRRLSQTPRTPKS
jgi:hypothetical protein